MLQIELLSEVAGALDFPQGRCWFGQRAFKDVNSRKDLGVDRLVSLDTQDQRGKYLIWKAHLFLFFIEQIWREGTEDFPGRDAGVYKRLKVAYDTSAVVQYQSEWDVTC